MLVSINTADRTAERIARNYDFSEDVIARVSETAEWQNRYDFETLVAKYHLENGPQIIHPAGALNPVEILEFVPSNLERPERARVIHTAFGSSITPQTTLRAMRLFGADPSERLIVMGGASAPGRKVSKLTWDQAGYVAYKNDLRPVVEPILMYLSGLRVSETSHGGYSAGARKGLDAIFYSELYDQHVTRGVLVEPADLVRRSMYRLTRTFISTLEHQSEYIEQSDCPANIKTWQQDGRFPELKAKIEFGKYCAKLLRLSNLAVATCLKQDGFSGRLTEVMAGQPELEMLLGWGTTSEITDGNAMRAIVDDDKTGRVHAMELENMYHAAIEDLDLFAAQMLQGFLLSPTQGRAEQVSSPRADERAYELAHAA
jgi:hypothetical protein